MSSNRRVFSAELKAETVRRHVMDKVPVSDLADELQVQPGVIHTWVRQVLDQAERAFQVPKGRKPNAGADPKDRQISQLKAKLVNKNEVIAELMEENVKAKKSNGEL